MALKWKSFVTLIQPDLLPQKSLVSGTLVLCLWMGSILFCFAFGGYLSQLSTSVFEPYRFELFDERLSEYEKHAPKNIPNYFAALLSVPLFAILLTLGIVWRHGTALCRSFAYSFKRAFDGLILLPFMFGVFFWAMFCIPIIDETGGLKRKAVIMVYPFLQLSVFLLATFLSLIFLQFIAALFLLANRIKPKG